MFIFRVCLDSPLSRNGPRPFFFRFGCIPGPVSLFLFLDLGPCRSRSLSEKGNQTLLTAAEPNLPRMLCSLSFFPFLNRYLFSCAYSACGACRVPVRRSGAREVERSSLFLSFCLAVAWHFWPPRRP